MYRSDVVYRVVMMPMCVKVQREGGKWVACMPGWRLQTSLIVDADDEGDAILKLEQKMREYWTPSNYK
jgi:hypothetical protein